MCGDAASTAALALWRAPSDLYTHVLLAVQGVEAVFL